MEFWRNITNYNAGDVQGETGITKEVVNVNNKCVKNDKRIGVLQQKKLKKMPRSI